MKVLIGLVILATALLTEGGAGAANWSFVYVSRSTDFIVSTGLAQITLESDKIAGELTDEAGVIYYFGGRRDGERISAHFGAVESDDGGTQLTGTLKQVIEQGSGKCWQTLQLSDGYSSLSLARNVATCEP